MSLRSTARAVLIAAGALSLTTHAQAGEGYKLDNPADFLIDHAEEVELARSAGPEGISSQANILVLGADGTYTEAVEGTNGWTCFNGRSWAGPATFRNGVRVWSEAQFDPKIRAPQCFNASAAESMLAVHRLTTKLFMNGATHEEVDLAVGHALASGTIQTPQPGAMSYMYSPKQFLGERAGRFMPHVMLYMPFVTQESFGPVNRQMTVPVVTDSGSVFSTTVVMSSHWSDGTPARPASGG